MSSRSALAANATALLLAGAAMAQTPPPRTNDAATPADAASGATTSMNRGSGTTSDDSGVTSLGAEAGRGRTASGNVVLSARDMRGLARCRAMSRDEQIHSSLCKRLDAKDPAEFNPDGTARPLPH